MQSSIVNAHACSKKLMCMYTYGGRGSGKVVSMYVCMYVLVDHWMAAAASLQPSIFSHPRV